MAVLSLGLAAMQASTVYGPGPLEPQKAAMGVGSLRGARADDSVGADRHQRVPKRPDPHHLHGGPESDPGAGSESDCGSGVFQLLRRGDGGGLDRGGGSHFELAAGRGDRVVRGAVGCSRRRGWCAAAGLGGRCVAAVAVATGGRTSARQHAQHQHGGRPVPSVRNAFRFVDVQWLYPYYAMPWGPVGSIVYFAVWRRSCSSRRWSPSTSVTRDGYRLTWEQWVATRAG